MTNVSDRQTCTVGHLNLVRSTVAFLHMETLKIICQMIRCPSVHHPGRRASRCSVAGTLIVVVAAHEVGIVAVPTIRGNMPPVAADLALWALMTTTTVLATTVATAAAVSAIAAVVGAVVAPALLTIGLTIATSTGVVLSTAGVVPAVFWWLPVPPP
jgi:hypothetical protein